MICKTENVIYIPTKMLGRSSDYLGLRSERMSIMLRNYSLFLFLPALKEILNKSWKKLLQNPRWEPNSKPTAQQTELLPTEL